MKLLRILGVFLAISLFAGCEVWISFWGAADGDREIDLDVTYPSIYRELITLRARLYQKSGIGYLLVDSRNAGDSTVMVTSFTGLPSGTYKVMVWNDEDGDGNPDYDTDAELGFTTAPLDLYLFAEYTVEADTPTEWRQDDSDFVTPP